MSRTGRVYGDVDEGFAVQVVARRGDDVLSIERLHGGDRYDPNIRNRIGGMGAYVSQWPSADAVEAAIERAKGQSGERTSGIHVIYAPQELRR